ncbi:hypothetical protein [Natronorubrum sp. DTA7]|uniref:hypothetical protein n=1 Tax=Natronorubrum sp. DTA7 TaxID=3447016 RepID=UPI003F84D8BB
MNLLQGSAAVLIGLFVFANLLHPGGWLVTGIIVALILVAYVLAEFTPEYILTTNQGKNARKSNRQRRATGLNPFSRTSRRDSESRQQTQTSQNHGDNNE